MNSLTAAFLSATVICGGLALLFAPILLVIIRFIAGVVFAVLAVALALITLSLAALDHVHLVAPTLVTPTAAALNGCILTFGFLALTKARRTIATRRDAAVPRLARSVTRRGFMEMARTSPASSTQDNFNGAPVRDTSVTRDAIAALVSLGYKSRDASTAVAAASALLGPRADISALVRAALRRAT
jgi:hypothetical protein